MNILLLGAAGFIGTNLALRLLDDPDNRITLVDVCKEYFPAAVCQNGANVSIVECPMNEGADISPECSV